MAERKTIEDVLSTPLRDAYIYFIEVLDRDKGLLDRFRQKDPARSIDWDAIKDAHLSEDRKG